MNGEKEPDIIYISSPYVRSTTRGGRRALRSLCGMLGSAVLVSACVVSFADSIGLNFAAKTEYSDASEHLYEDIPENSIVNDAEPPEISNAEGENSVSEKNTELTADTESIADSNSEAEQLPANVSSGNHQIIMTDLSRNPGADILIDNKTSYTPNISAMLSSSCSVSGSTFRENPAQVTVTETEGSMLYSVGNQSPTVLIIHTHGTECYSQNGSSYSEAEIGFRSKDTNENMIAVGKKTAQTLSEHGISVLHCTIMHDAESYNNSYNYAAKTIKSLITKYPSISYVLDMHRDAIQYDDGSIARPTIKTDLGDTAQLMFVIGTDELGANHPNWEKNLSLAVRLQSALNSETANLVRPISLRGAAYNEQYTDGSILVEVGACGNTLAEAENAAVLLADTLAGITLSGK